MCSLQKHSARVLQAAIIVLPLFIFIGWSQGSSCSPTLETPCILTGHESGVRSVAFTPSNSILISSSKDSTIRYWDVTNGTQLKILRGHSSDVQKIAINDNTSLLASGSSDRTIKLWDLETGTVKFSLSSQMQWVTDIAFIPDGDLLASCGILGNRSVNIWDTATGALIRTFIDYSAFVWDVAINHDGTLLASSGYEAPISEIIIRNIDTGERLFNLTGHSGKAVINFHPNGKHFISASPDVLKLWDIETGKEVKSMPLQGADSISISPNGELLAIGQSGSISMWGIHLDAEFEILNLQSLTGHLFSPIWGLAFSPDGTLLASASEDRTIRIWNVSDLYDR